MFPGRGVADEVKGIRAPPISTAKIGISGVEVVEPKLK